MRNRFLRHAFLATLALGTFSVSAHADGILGDTLHTVDKTTGDAVGTAKDTTHNTWQDTKQTTRKALGQDEKRAKQRAQKHAKKKTTHNKSKVAAQAESAAATAQ